MLRTTFKKMNVHISCDRQDKMLPRGVWKKRIDFFESLACRKSPIESSNNSLNAQIKTSHKVKENTETSVNMDDDDFVPPPARGRRQAVAAESYDPTAEDEESEIIVVNPKTSEQLKCLEEAAKGIIFFEKCDAEQKRILFDAMFEKRVKEGDVIIRQGDDGDNFYVIEEGKYDVLIKDGDGEKKVATLQDKGFFGELALLYNCPRNATIMATGEGILWGLDQKTFRQIVVKATAKKRKTFETLLMGVSMLDSLTPYELMNLTDALDEKRFSKGEEIIKEGDSATNMYFIMQGEVSVRVTDKNTNTEQEVVKLNRGRYFGELALVLQKPRVASVYSYTDDTKCAVLNINAFERLLGPCVEIMKRNVHKYEEERKKLGINSISNELNGTSK
ncbi:cAMP-dependent protein kinase type II regulatory subunit-like isoform X3 [Hydractinia symbiolongicarpus]|uniref:cAMP-dependent protein kinase type II regulatory subunit-like isoform X3 n=1 Tax=Hydractinia symbiolongicarpus TaxID=13093 RepID=UPI0025506D7C|nr:cAMP-dependent protein kinase type II regulatory subunit-like isoform X3 [Hydractinia symbiolongicarpus]